MARMTVGVRVMNCFAKEHKLHRFVVWGANPIWLICDQGVGTARARVRVRARVRFVCTAGLGLLERSSTCSRSVPQAASLGTPRSPYDAAPWVRVMSCHVMS